MPMKTIFCCVGVLLLWLSTSVQAAVVRFTPSGVATVAQDAQLFWDPTSGATSTSSAFDPWRLELSAAGDVRSSLIHAKIATAGGTTQGINFALGEEIGVSTNFGSTTSYWAGTTGFGGGCDFGETCIYGYRFVIGTGTHYGWVQFTEGDDGSQSLLSWAYEDTPGASVLAGLTAPATIPVPAALPMGLTGLVLLALLKARRKETSAATTASATAPPAG